MGRLEPWDLKADTLTREESCYHYPPSPSTRNYSTPDFLLLEKTRWLWLEIELRLGRLGAFEGKKRASSAQPTRPKGEAEM